MIDIFFAIDSGGDDGKYLPSDLSCFEPFCIADPGRRWHLHHEMLGLAQMKQEVFHGLKKAATKRAKLAKQCFGCFSAFSECVCVYQLLLTARFASSMMQHLI